MDIFRDTSYDYADGFSREESMPRRKTLGATREELGMNSMTFEPAGVLDLAVVADLRAHREVFRVFADLDGTTENIDKFIRDYLGTLIRPRDLSVKGRRAGENLAEWQTNIRQMKATVELWHMISVREIDFEKLARHLFWGADQRGILHIGFSAAELPKNSTGKDWDIHVSIPGESTELVMRLLADGPKKIMDGWAARRCLQEFLNEKLKDRIVVHMRWKRKIERSSTTDPVRIERDADAPPPEWDLLHSRLGLELVPVNLFALVWLQLAQAVANNEAFRKCVTCKRWFYLPKAIVKKKKQFCSNACRSRLYREHQEKACELHANGVPLKEIAAKLGSSVDVVKGWLLKAAE
jgi:hypothetical protein